MIAYGPANREGGNTSAVSIMHTLVVKCNKGTPKKVRLAVSSLEPGAGRYPFLKA